ncbi:MAG TPA: EAL domain-containing protein [Propylenella sp.]
MRFAKVIQFVLLSTIAALVVAGLYTSVVIRERQQALDQILRYNVAYDASQAVIEFVRLQKSLLKFQNDRTAENRDDIRLRIEILFNRLQLFGSGEFGRFVEMDARRNEVFEHFSSVIGAVEPIALAEGMDLEAAAPLALLDPVERDLIGFASEANRYVAAVVAADHQKLVELHWRFSSLTFGLMTCGLALGGMLMWHNRLLMRAHVRLSATTTDLQQTATELAMANNAVEEANEELRNQNALLVQKENALKEQVSLFNAALNNMSQGLCMFDDDMVPIVYNAQFRRLFHVDTNLLPTRAEQNRSRVTLRDLAPDLALEIGDNVHRSRAATFETECSDKRIIAVVQQPMPQGGWVATFEDVTEQRRTQARIAHMARHDGLTNLPNRYAFRERIQGALQECAETGTMLAVMCLDLDNFKEVNDTLGHPTGDALLCAAAERLSGCIRESDMVARFGGDEFAVLQPFIERFDDAERLAARLVDEMRKPFHIKGELVYATGSVGIALSPRHGHDPDVLMKNADLALYAAKADGRRTYRFFDTAMDERLTNRHSMERDLRQAIATGGFDIHYQPVVHLRSMKMTGLEALLRWTHPVHGVVPPSKFIPVAEEAGLISEIGRWVLREATRDATKWPPHLKVSVNLSAAQFAQGDIVEDIREAMSRAGLRPERLVVEITESLLLTENMGTVDTLNRLKALGVGIAMDDFGTGYSSLSYLRKYPFDRIKIDRAFVNSAGHGDQSAAIIRTIVQLGASLGMTTVAEGVETEEHLNMLLAAGCPEGQGYLFSRPVPRDQVFEIVSAHERKMSKVA